MDVTSCSTFFANETLGNTIAWKCNFGDNFALLHFRDDFGDEFGDDFQIHLQNCTSTLS